MRIPARVVAVVFAISLPAGLLATRQQPPAPPPAQQPPAQQPPVEQVPAQPPIRIGINYVRVDVIVTDKGGTPVLDLKQEEFSLAEDGKPQKIDSFSIVKIDPLAQLDESRPPIAIRSKYDEEQEAARPDVRLFVILLDDYHVRRGSDLAVRKPLIDFIQNQLAPADMVALMYPLTPVTELSFTRNHESLIGAISRFEGRKFIYEPRNSFEEQYAFYPTAVVERIRNQVTMDALKGACVRMGGLREGRKSVIMISEGFTSTLPTQMNDPVAARPGVNNPNRNNPFAPQANDMQRLMNESDMNFDMRQVFDTCNRQNTSLYPVDPRGLAVFEYGINEGIGLQTDATGLRSTMDTLHVLAANTDGRAIVNRNDLAAGMKQIMRDSSAYYLLGYNSSQAPTDGKFHKIEVNVKRRGVDVRARKGYWAYTLDDVARASAPSKPYTPSPITNALSELATPARGRPARFWIGTARAASGSTRVTFVWEPIAPVHGDRAAEPASRVALTVTTPDGRPLFKGKVPDAAPAPAPADAAATGGAVSFEVPPGQFQLRMIVEGDRGQVMDSSARELTAPDFTKVQLSIGTPRVFRARSVKELQTLKTNADAFPIADREFSRTDRILIRFDAYAPGGAVPAVTARLLNRGGQSMADLPVRTAPGAPAELDLALAPLSANDYVIELNAKSDAGTAQELVAIRISR